MKYKIINFFQVVGMIFNTTALLSNTFIFPYNIYKGYLYYLSKGEAFSTIYPIMKLLFL